MGRVKEAMLKQQEDTNFSRHFTRAGVDVLNTPADYLPESAGIYVGMCMLHDDEDRGTSPRLSDE